jgi:hypothetical protein
MIVAQYDINASMASVVGGTGNEIKYFLSRPVQKLWNSGKVGVYSPSTPVPRELPLPFEKINGSRFEVYASGYASATKGSVTYLIQAKDSSSEKITLVRLSNVPGTVDLPFHVKLVLEGNGLFQGTVQSMIAGVFESEKGMKPFAINSPFFSLMIGVQFEVSAEDNKAALTEFKVVQPN